MQLLTSQQLPKYDLPPYKFIEVRYSSIGLNRLHVSIQNRLYLHPFPEAPISNRLVVLPFGIVVEPSSIEAWLLITYTAFQQLKGYLTSHCCEGWQMRSFTSSTTA